MLRVKQVPFFFLKVFGITQPGIEPRSSGPLANTLPTRPLSRFVKFTNIYIHYDFIYSYPYLLDSNMILCVFNVFSSDITTLIFVTNRCKVK